MATTADQPAAPALDWRHATLGSRPGKCITCTVPTIMRNLAGKPQHKVCAEQVAAGAARAIRTTASQLGTPA